MDVKIVESSVGSGKAISGIWFSGRYEIDASLEVEDDSKTLWIDLEAYRFDEGVWKVSDATLTDLTITVNGQQITKPFFEDLTDKDYWLQPHIAEEFEKYFENDQESREEMLKGL